MTPGRGYGGPSAGSGRASRELCLNYLICFFAVLSHRFAFTTGPMGYHLVRPDFFVIRHNARMVALHKANALN